MRYAQALRLEGDGLRLCIPTVIAPRFGNPQRDAGLDPHQTLVVIASKSFTTAETLENARRAIEWIQNAGIRDAWQQVVAITARPMVE